MEKLRGRMGELDQSNLMEEMTEFMRLIANFIFGCSFWRFWYIFRIWPLQTRIEIKKLRFL